MNWPENKQVTLKPWTDLKHFSSIYNLGVLKLERTKFLSLELRTQYPHRPCTAMIETVRKTYFSNYHPHNFWRQRKLKKVRVVGREKSNHWWDSIPWILVPWKYNTWRIGLLDHNTLLQFEWVHFQNLYKVFCFYQICCIISRTLWEKIAVSYWAC